MTEEEKPLSIAPESDLTNIAIRQSRAQPAGSLAQDPNLVTWQGSEDQDNPKNWPLKRKWMASVPMSLFNFLGAMSSAAAAPALPAIAIDLKIESRTLLIMVLSIYNLGTAITPLFTAPLSEIFGRVRILQVSNLFYIIFNTACGFAKTQNQLIVFRLLAGLGGSGPQAIGSGINSDLFRAHERGKAIAVYTALPLLGPIIGPIAGGFLVQYKSWRWCFYIVSIASAAVQIFGFFIFRETYAPVLLNRRCIRLRKETGNPNLYTAYDSKSFPALMRTSLARPFRLLWSQPIVQVLSLYAAYINGILYLMAATFPQVWTGIYHETPSIGSLNYLSIAVGMIVAAQLGTRLADHLYKQLCNQNGGHGKPEFRLPVLFIGAFIVPIGLFWYGWSAKPDIHWVMPNIGAALYAGATLLSLQCIQGYLVDTYLQYAASAMASVTVLKSLFGFALPMCAPNLYSATGFAWGNSTLAFIAIGIGIPAPFLLWVFGEALRKRSTYARSNDSEDVFLPDGRK